MRLALRPPGRRRPASRRGGRLGSRWVRWIEGVPRFAWEFARDHAVGPPSRGKVGVLLRLGLVGSLLGNAWAHGPRSLLREPWTFWAAMAAITLLHMGHEDSGARRR
jgi:hypothetical protein